MLVTVYVTLIIGGHRNFSQVPASLKASVKAELELMGIGEDGIPLA